MNPIRPLLLVTLGALAAAAIHAESQTLYFRHGASRADPAVPDASSVHRTTLIRSDQPDAGSPDQYFITGGAGASRALRGVLQFDLAALPPDAVVTSVSLQLRTLPGPDGGSLNTDVAFAIHALGNQPVPVEATWNRAAAGRPWVTPGGDYTEPPLAVATVNTQSDTYKDVVWSGPDLASQVAAAAAGDGLLNLLLKAPGAVESSADRALVWFYAATVTQILSERPLLTVEYSGEAPPPPPPPPPEDPLPERGAPEIDDAAIADIFHVDPVFGDDANPGTAQRPVRTVNRALQLANAVNALGRPVKVILAPGEYFENSPDMAWNSGMINVPAFRSPAPVILEGAGWAPGTHTGDVIISGSEVWTGWTEEAASFNRPWPYGDWGTDPSQASNAPPMARRFEGVHVDENGDGQFSFYHQMAGAADPYIGNLYAHEGYFYLDLAGGRLHVIPPDGVDLNGPGVTVRVTTRKRLLYLYQPSLSATPGHMVLRNLFFRHGGSAGAYLQNIVTATVEDCVFQGNQYTGLIVESSAVSGRSTIRRCEVLENGVIGFSVNGKGCLAEDIRVARNARLAYVHEYFGWANCGMKIGGGHDVTFRRWVVEDNYGHGAWLDTDILNLEFHDSVFRGNTESGIFLEHNNRNSTPGLGDQYTAIVTENIFHDNIAPSAPLAVDPSKFRTGKAIQFSEHENALVKNNLMYGNQRVFHFSHNVRGPMENNILRWNLAAAPAWAEDGFHGGMFQAWRDFIDTLTNETDCNYYFQDKPLPFIDRNLNQIGFAEFRELLQTNRFNPFPRDTIEAASVFVQADYDGAPLVVVRAMNRTIEEGAGPATAFRIRRLTPDLAGDLTVPVRFREGPGFVDSTDLAGSLPATVTIADGEDAATVVIEALADGIPEGPEILEIELLPGEGWLPGESTARVTVVDLDAPDINQVSIHALVETVRESAGTVAAFRVSRSGDTAEPLAVSYAVGGTATPGADYAALTGLAVIPADSAEADIELTLIDDDQPEVLKTIVLTLQPATAGEYVLMSPVEATLLLVDDDLVQPRSITAELGAGDGPVTWALTVENPGDAPLRYEVLLPAGYELFDSDSGQPAPYLWIDIAAPQNRVAFNWVFPNDDGLSAALPLGFEFPFFGETHTAVHVHSNGFLTFTEQSGTFAANQPLPSDDSRVPRCLVAPLWRNLGLDAESGVYAGRVGELFIVQFDGMIAFPSFVTKRRASFQVLLHANGVVTFNYKQNDTGASHTVGIQNADGSEAVLAAYNEAYVRPEFSVRFVPATAWISPLAAEVDVPARGRQTVELEVRAELMPFGEWRLPVVLRPVDSAGPPIEVPVTLLAVPPAAAWADALPVGAGWIWSGWFGLLEDYAPAWPGWIRSDDHGLMQVQDIDSSSLWTWNATLGWSWLHKAHYPRFHSARRDSWVYYLGYPADAGLLRYFYVYHSGQWLLPGEF